MRILDRYILKSVVTVFFSCIFLFLFLYVIIDLLSHLEDVLKQHATIRLLIEYYLSYMPVMFVQVAPFACLLSTLYTFGRLNHNNEIIAMRSSGISIYGLSKSVILFGLLISLFVFYVGDRVVPKSLVVSQKLKTQIEEGRKKEKKFDPIPNLSMYGLKNRLFFVNTFYPATNTMEGIIILEHDEHQNIVKKIVANKGVYKDGLWKFYQSITYNFDGNGQVVNEPQFMEEEIMSIPESPADILSQRERPDYMTIAQLDDYIWRLSKSGATSVIRNLKTEYYERFTAPLTSLIIILLGIPFSLIMRRRATGLSSIGISIAVGFLYYILDAVCGAIGRGGLLFPLAAASLSHLTALALSIYLIRNLP